MGEWSSYLRQKYGLDRLFKQVIISGDVCYRKPSPEIYKIFLEKSGCCASDCVFIDDRHKNLVPAGELGMNVIKFTREGISEGEYKGIEIQSFVQLPSVLEKLFFRVPKKFS
ncbi:MAG: HAD family hydrolase [Firmicutes bacterium]|nr:HAD family hydrolase [Bacillota bacterium]